MMSGTLADSGGCTVAPASSRKRPVSDFASRDASQPFHQMMIAVAAKTARNNKALVLKTVQKTSR